MLRKFRQDLGFLSGQSRQYSHYFRMNIAPYDYLSQEISPKFPKVYVGLLARLVKHRDYNVCLDGSGGTHLRGGSSLSSFLQYIRC